MKYQLRKIEDTWFIIGKDGDLVESFDTRREAEKALWDFNRGWTSLYDVEHHLRGC